MSSKAFDRVFQTLLVLALLLYPLGVYFGLKSFSVGTVGWILAAIISLRLFKVRSGDPLTIAVILGAVAGVSLNVLAAVTNSPLLMKFYPVVMSLIFLFLFTGSLFSEATIVARIARRLSGPLPPEAIRYTTRVTVIWCGFFLVNASVAAYTALFASEEVWAFYNGFLSYILMGLLFAGEFSVRRALQRKASA